MENKIPMTVKEIIPVDVALVKFVDGESKESMILAAIASNIASMEDNDRNLVGSVKVIDWLMPDGKWRNTGGVSRWMALGIKNILKEAEGEDVTETVSDQMESV